MAIDVLKELNLNQNEIQNALMHGLAAAPSNPKVNQYYWNTTTNTMHVWNGTEWKQVGIGYTLPVATSSALGGITVNGNHLTINGTTGLLAVNEASTSQKGVIEMATDSEASTGTSETLAVNPKQLATKVTANSAITAGTKCKVTYDSKGLVTGGANLTSSDIPDISATYVAVSTKGQANGVATLGSDGKVPTAQLPSFVDDVIDSYIVGSTPLASNWLSLSAGGSALTPETGKIYVILTTGAYLNKTYRWSGTTYVEISAAPGQATESAAGIAEIATTAEVTTGSDDTRIVTPAKLAAKISGMTKKATVTNPAMTPSGGVCTWSITNTISDDAVVMIKEVSSGAEVYTDVTFGSGTITVKINSSTNISAGTYKAIIIG